MLPQALLGVRPVGCRMGRTLRSHQPSHAWCIGTRVRILPAGGCVGWAALVGIPEQMPCASKPCLQRHNLFSFHPSFRSSHSPQSASSPGWHCLLIPSGHSVEIFEVGDSTWKWVQALPDPPVSTYRYLSHACRIPASQDANSCGTPQRSAAGSDLSIILYPHAFNFYSPVGAIPRVVNNASPPASHVHPSCSHQGAKQVSGLGKCRHEQAGVVAPVSVPPPSSQPPR